MPLASVDEAAGPFDSLETEAGNGSVNGVTDTGAMGARDAAAGAIIVVSGATCVTGKTPRLPFLA